MGGSTKREYDLGCHAGSRGQPEVVVPHGPAVVRCLGESLRAEPASERPWEGDSAAPASRRGRPRPRAVARLLRHSPGAALPFCPVVGCHCLPHPLGLCTAVLPGVAVSFSRGDRAAPCGHQARRSGSGACTAAAGRSWPVRRPVARDARSGHWQHNVVCTQYSWCQWPLH
jgi:hypothetical protein